MFFSLYIHMCIYIFACVFNRMQSSYCVFVNIYVPDICNWMRCANLIHTYVIIYTCDLFEYAFHLFMYFIWRIMSLYISSFTCVLSKCHHSILFVICCDDPIWYSYIWYILHVLFVYICIPYLYIIHPFVRIKWLLKFVRVRWLIVFRTYSISLYNPSVREN